MGMNSELSGKDKTLHEEASTLQKIARLIRSARNESKNIFERTNDYRAKVILMDLSEAEALLDKLELEIIEQIRG